ncbi:hypothetical protein [uncultured Ilyobacter sp.]|uniref:hypothetical protein n=1 Tax=uncultured Ilyobacter sp. TaxID=544433 RepID=UPI0029BFE9A1|nr:hypothetical protein [uncultured Ilyobacter sp.]
MKLYRYFILILFVLATFTGCSNADRSRLHFDSKPYNFITGENSNDYVELFLLKVDDIDNRFYIQIKSKENLKVSKEIRGKWDMKNGILFMTTEDSNKLIKISGYNSYPRVIYSDIPQLYYFNLNLSPSVYRYSGNFNKDNSKFSIDLKLFEKEKSIPVYIIPPDEQENSFFITVIESIDGKTVSHEELTGDWIIKEKILYLKLDDDTMYFKTGRDSIELVNYENRYDIDQIILKKVK